MYQHLAGNQCKLLRLNEYSTVLFDTIGTDLYTRRLSLTHESSGPTSGPCDGLLWTEVDRVDTYLMDQHLHIASTPAETSPGTLMT